MIGGRSGEAGLVLIGLWLLGQLGATDLVFASGDLRSLLGIPAPLPFRPERFIAFDTALAASGAARDRAVRALHDARRQPRCRCCW